MKILFTGASSFTGYWFVKTLVEQGHEVVATFQRPLETYEGVAATRISALPADVKKVTEVSFGDETFCELVASESRWDMLCHHAADVTNYKSADFDVVSAVANNTFNIANVLKLFGEKSCQHLMLTGSVFENDEGAGSGARNAESAGVY